VYLESVEGMQNRVFFPQAALDQWIVDGTVDLSGNELTIVGAGRRDRLAEALRVMREVTTGTDPNDLLGRVKTRGYLEELGAEVVESSMILGDTAYDVEPGWLGAPIGTFDEHVGSAARKQSRGHRHDPMGDEPRTDEDLLAKFLVKNL
jgi:hypothetical protein